MNKDGLTIAFTGGGTGRHVFPIVSLIQYGQKHSEMMKKCKQVYRIGETGSMEAKESVKLHDVTFVPILAGKIRRYRSGALLNIRDLVKIILAFFQSLRYLQKYKIDIVFCKGGYVALPVCFAAKLLGKKIMVHESDMHPGLTNRIVAKFAEKIFTGFPKTFPTGAAIGQILSDDLGTYDSSGLDVDIGEKTNVVVMGGSQGMASVYTTLLEILGTGEIHDMMFYVITGTRNKNMQETFSKYDHVQCFDFLSQQEIAKLYSICDVSITRGGVTSLAEQEIFGIKKIIVPHPDGGGYHQFKNALWYSDAYEDIVVEQDTQLKNNLTTFLTKLSDYKKNWNGVEAESLEKAKKTIWDVIGE